MLLVNNFNDFSPRQIARKLYHGLRYLDEMASLFVIILHLKIYIYTHTHRGIIKSLNQIGNSPPFSGYIWSVKTCILLLFYIPKGSQISFNSDNSFLK